MRKIVLLVGILSLIVSFQNCAPQNGLNPTTGEAVPVYEKYAALPADQVTFWDYSQYRYIDVDLDSGIMSVFEEMGGSRGPIYCLNENERDHLNHILNSAEVCEPVVDNLSEGKVCTMLYTFPYASLKVSGEETRLGERTSGCDIPVDLCGEKASEFKNFVSSVVENLSAHQCSQ